MSGAYDMSGVMADDMTSDSVYPSPFYLPYLIFGYNEVYHLFANDSDVLVHPYDSTLPPLFDGAHSEGQANNAMPNVPKYIMQPVQLDSFINDSVTNFFRVRLAENNTYNWVPNSPLRMFFCAGDHSVPYGNALVAYAHFQQQGATLVDTLDPSPTSDHVPCAQYAILDATTWFDSLVYKPVVAAGVTVHNSTSASSPNGSAVANYLLGHAPYTFSWSNGSSTDSISGLEAGTYYVTVTDGSHCMYVDSVVVQLISGMQEQVLTNISIYPNPASSVIHIRNSNSGDPLTYFDLLDMSGQTVKTYPIRQGNNVDLFLDNLAGGIYGLHLKSQSGKEVVRKITVIQ